MSTAVNTRSIATGTVGMPDRATPDPDARSLRIGIEESASRMTVRAAGPKDASEIAKTLTIPDPTLRSTPAADRVSS
jgi:hypothetical protein